MTLYARIHTLQTRGPIEGMPDREVDGVLFSADQSILDWEGAHKDAGHDQFTLWPAYHNGAQCWILSRRWVAAHGYSAWGTQTDIIPLEEGIAILVDRGVFRLPEVPKTIGLPQRHPALDVEFDGAKLHDLLTYDEQARGARLSNYKPHTFTSAQRAAVDLYHAATSK